MSTGSVRGAAGAGEGGATRLPKAAVAGPRPPLETTRRRRRDRRGRGLRSPLLPAELPGARTRSEQFDQAVLDAAAELEERWPNEVAAIEFAVDEVPPVPAGGVVTPSAEVVLDGGVPLARFSPPGVDGRGRATKARIVVYRRPLEVRALDGADLSDLVVEVLAEQVSAIVGEPGPDPA